MMPGEALIACVVPVFNCVRYVGEALDSILAQSHRALEVVVVDDGSTDETAEVVARYGERGVRAVRQENAGPAAARNRGIGEVGAPFIAFLDADDIWLPDKLERQMARFEQRSELDLVSTHFDSFWTPDLAEQEEKYQDPRRGTVLPGLIPTMLVRQTVFERVGLFDQSLVCAEDQDWFLRAEDAGVVMEVLPQVLLRRRLHPDNLTRRAGSAGQQDLLRVVRMSLARRREAAGRDRKR